MPLFRTEIDSPTVSFRRGFSQTRSAMTKLRWRGWMLNSKNASRSSNAKGKTLKLEIFASFYRIHIAKTIHRQPGAMISFRLAGKRDTWTVFSGSVIACTLYLRYQWRSVEAAKSRKCKRWYNFYALTSHGSIRDIPYRLSSLWCPRDHRNYGNIEQYLVTEHGVGRRNCFQIDVARENWKFRDWQSSLLCGE